MCPQENNSGQSKNMGERWLSLKSWIALYLTLLQPRYRISSEAIGRMFLNVWDIQLIV